MSVVLKIMKLTQGKTDLAFTLMQTQSKATTATELLNQWLCMEELNNL